jgi:arylformamidase
MTRPDPQWLERMYNNRALVPDHEAYFRRWAAESAAVRAAQPCRLDLRYGEGPNETLDIFPTAAPGAPVLVFIHGGYWRSLDKSDHSFLAPAFTRAGACVVMLNYALCPGPDQDPVTVPRITLQLVRALAWVWRHIAAHGADPARISVAGHSVGGHAAAMLLSCLWQAHDPALPRRLVRNGLSISGLYELAPLLRVPFLQGVLRLTPRQARQASPALLPRPAAGELYTVAGGAESAEFLRHNRLIREAWGPRTVPVCEPLPGLNHFSVVDALAEPGHRLQALALQLLA